MTTRLFSRGTVANRSRPRPIEIVRHCAVLTTATALSVAAQQTDHPVTAGLVLMVGVLANGASGGLGAGLWSAAVASFIYNFFIRFPVFTFGLSSIDDYVPVIAFTTTAAVSGLLSGRLKDRAESAEQARGHLDLLLGFSNRLQRAVTLDEVVDALRQAVSPQTARSLVLPYLEAHHPIDRSAEWRAAVDRAFGGPGDEDERDGIAYRLRFQDVDLDAFVGLLWMAIERCDLLDQRADAEAVRRSDEFKTAVLSSLSHDLRTPIAAISASVTSLLRFGHVFDDAIREQMLGTIRDQSERLDRFTAKMLSLGRLQAGVSDARLELVDVGDVLGSAIRAVRVLQPGRQIEKQVGESPAQVLADPAMLEQVLFNILENAIGYSPEETGVCVCLVAGDAVVTVSVIDEGAGIAPENLDRIFDRFFRCEGGRRDGQGLGLSIARGFVEAFGGGIRAISPVAAGRGTEIRIVLPLAPAKETALA